MYTQEQAEIMNNKRDYLIITGSLQDDTIRDMNALASQYKEATKQIEEETNRAGYAAWLAASIAARDNPSTLAKYPAEPAIDAIYHNDTFRNTVDNYSHRSIWEVTNAPFILKMGVIEVAA